jgi:hypothetical protein
MAKYVISYDKNVDFSTLQSSLIASGCTVGEVFESLGALTVESPNTDFSSVVGVLAHEVESEIVVNPHWHLNRICSENLPMRKMYLSRNKGLGSTVYLMDSGVDTTHPEFINSTIEHLWSWDGDSTDTNGHGTGLASVIVGATLGVSVEATLKSVKIPLSQSIPVSTLLNAFNVILNDHLLTPGLKVVNCSWTIPKSLILDNKITELQQQGLIVVAAAGNEIADANTFSPVGLNTVLGVAASDAYDRVISWATGVGSNWGPDVDITAPGIDITIAKLGGETEQKSGTSIAAAVVAGAACQYIVDSPSVTSSAVLRDMILTDAKEDILFRNESIYGTTPNRLLHIPFIDLIISPAKDSRIIYVQKGTTVTLPLQLSPVVGSLNIDDVLAGASRRTSPSWVTLADNILTISPPTNIEGSGIYVLEIDILNDSNVSIGYTQIMIKVYQSSVEELDGRDIYFYHKIDENENVVVLQSFCGGFCVSNTTCVNAGGKVCGCAGYGCGSF